MPEDVCAEEGASRRGRNRAGTGLGALEPSGVGGGGEGGPAGRTAGTPRGRSGGGRGARGSLCAGSPHPGLPGVWERAQSGVSLRGDILSSARQPGGPAETREGAARRAPAGHREGMGAAGSKRRPLPRPAQAGDADRPWEGEEGAGSLGCARGARGALSREAGGFARAGARPPRLPGGWWSVPGGWPPALQVGAERGGFFGAVAKRGATRRWIL